MAPKSNLPPDDFGIDPGVLDRWLAGSILATDETAIRRWIAEQPSRAGILRAMLEGLGRDHPGDWHESGRWATVKERCGMTGSSHSAGNSRGQAQMRRPPLRRRVSGWGIGSLVAATVFVLLGWGIRQSSKGPGLPRVWTETFATRNGERATLRLGDGTTVLLAPASTIRLFHGSSDSVQETYLEGGAEFTVIHNPRRHFVVRTPMAITRDLGTRFTVRAYANLPETQIAVLEGSVAVRAQNEPSLTAELREADIASLRRGQNIRIEHHADLQAALGWMNGRLLFDQTPLFRAIPQLEREYGLTILVPDVALRARKISVSLDRLSANEVLNAIALTLGVSIRRTGATVTFISEEKK